MAKIGIVGSRRRKCRDEVVALVDSLPQDTVVISGGCRGVDAWAEEAARARGLEVVVHLPKLPENGDYLEICKAYYARNRLIVEDSDMLYAFVSGDRRGGTENTVKHAVQLGKKIVFM